MGVTRRPRSPRHALRAASRNEVLSEALLLARELSLDVGEEEIVATVAGALRRLMPHRHFLLCVVDPGDLELSSIVAEGPLGPEARRNLPLAPLYLKRSALRQTRLPESLLDNQRVQIADAYTPLFAGAAAGFAVPLVAAGQLFGALHVEYTHAPKASLAAADERVAIPIANQLSVALRNLHLLGETRYYRDYLRQMIDVANALIVVVDRNERIAVANRAMQRFTDGEMASLPLLGARIDVLGAGGSDGVPSLVEVVRAGLVGDEHSDREVWVARQPGPGRAVFNTSTLRLPDGSIGGVIAIGQDIMRLRSLERQVIQVEKLATLGQLAAGVVHELNNPLTAISVYGDYCARLLDRLRKGGVVESDDVDKARKITDGAQRIQKLTRDLMSYARPAGEMDLVDLNDIARQAVSLCEPAIHRAEAQVELELEQPLPPIRGIATQLHQVFINLITNACHALPAPEQTIRLMTLSSDTSVSIEVADSGVGIDEADLPRVFEPFFTTKPEGKGTGLGLSIVKNIIEGHHGTITCHSTPGAGTTFRLTFPR